MSLRRLISQVSQRDKKGVSFLGTGSPPPNPATVNPSAGACLDSPCISWLLITRQDGLQSFVLSLASYFPPASHDRRAQAKYREGLVTPLPDGVVPVPRGTNER